MLAQIKPLAIPAALAYLGVRIASGLAPKKPVWQALGGVVGAGAGLFASKKIGKG